MVDLPILRIKLGIGRPKVTCHHHPVSRKGGAESWQPYVLV